VVAVWLIVNPKAGAGRAESLAAGAVPLLRRAHAEPVIHVCADGAEPARLAAAACSEGVELVVAVGGDGLVAGVAEGLLAAKQPASARPVLAVIATGSANDYARALGVRVLDLPTQVALMLDPRQRAQVDVVRVDSAGGMRHILNVGGTGFDARVARRAMGISRLRGGPRYLAATLAELPGLSAAAFELTVDGARLPTQALLVAIANGSTYGGGMHVAPDAHLQNGRLDVCVIGTLSRLAFLRAFPRVYRGSHVSHPAVTMLRAREVSIAADRPLEILGDGELIGSLPATFRVQPQALTVVAAPGAPLA
jgi:diacylglycerol kinase (ATP)